MGLLGSIGEGLRGGLIGASTAMADITSKEIEADIEATKAKRIAEMQKDVELSGRQKAFEQDVANAPQKTKMAADQAGAVTKATGQAETEVMSSPERLKAIRNAALAQHIVDPSITLVPGGDGRIMRVDARSGKAIGYLADPATGKEFQGPKDLPASQVEAAKSMFTQGAALMKDSMGDKATTTQANALFEQGRQLLTGKTGTATDEIRYDAQGNAYKKGPDGKPVLVTPKTAQPATSSAAPAAKPEPAKGIINEPSFNEAGYKTVDSTIDGAKKGNTKAKTLVLRWLNEGGTLTAQQRMEAQKAVGQ